MTLLWVALIFLAASVLILAEFILPGGVLGVLGSVLLVGGCAYGMITLPEYALFILVGEVLGTVFTVITGMYLLSNTRAGSALKLETAMSAEDGYENMHTDTSLIGRTGLVMTALRPAGIVEIDGRRLDVTSDGAFIEAGARVIVTHVSGNFLVVERAPEELNNPASQAV
ncbi:MAG: hypothetical protein RLZZ303_1384 [Candidatus Hydrogenedentota bacterium]|jgi:membrane-bound serine protease (ClpP class)